MSVADFLLALSQQYDIETITLQPTACLNARFRGADCTRCADICPAEAAITVTNGHPALSTDACLHCGLCLHRCPTGAFTRPDGFSRKLVRTAAAIPAGSVELVCPQHPHPTQGAVPYAIQTRRCLAAISAATLLELTATGKDIRLDDRYCAGCPLGAVQPELAPIVAEANGWAALLTGAGIVGWQSEQPDAPAVPRQLLDTTRPPVSRRGLWSAFKPQPTPAADTQTESTALVKPGRNIPPADRLPPSLPPERAAILDILSHQSQVNIETIPASRAQLPVAAVQVDPARCTACGLCAKFCPTGALKFLSDGDSFGLTYRPDICLGLVCNICQRACPEQAVSTTSTHVGPKALDKKSLAVGDLTCCSGCNIPIASGPGLPSTCFVCRARNRTADFFAKFS